MIVAFAASTLAAKVVAILARLAAVKLDELVALVGLNALLTAAALISYVNV